MANNPTTRLQQFGRFLEAKGWLSSTALPGILGTVSQSAGVPTGAVVEAGSNANGFYVKFADGTMISRIRQIPVVYVAAPRLGAAWNFPVAFIASPDCFWSWVPSPTGDTNNPFPTAAFTANSSLTITLTAGTTQLTVRAWPVGFSAQTTDVVHMDLLAVGRWF